MSRNAGTSFERYLTGLFRQYARQGRARIEKVDPPSVTTGKRTFLLRSPWLDYAGAWTERGGRALILEAKHTEKPVLAIARHGGLTERQWVEMNAWRAAGATTALLWRHAGQIKVLTPEIARSLLDTTARVSIRWCDVPRAIQGTGYARDDILTTIAAFDNGAK